VGLAVRLASLFICNTLTTIALQYSPFRLAICTLLARHIGSFTAQYSRFYSLFKCIVEEKEENK